MTIDFLIIGFGLAGASFGKMAENAGFTVHFIDVEKDNTASKVCAGIINPVVFKRLTGSWKINEALPIAQSFYNERENYFTERNIEKVIQNSEEADFWTKTYNSGKLNQYLGPLSDEQNYPYLKNDFAVGKVLKGGNVLVKKFLKEYSIDGKNRMILKQQEFNYLKLTINDDYVEYDNIMYKKIVFCEGLGALKNPWFPKNVFKPAMGELLLIKVPGLTSETILQKGVFILPMGKDEFLAGSTYNWDILESKCTEEGKSEIIEKLQNLISLPFQVIQHYSGVRPSTLDRRPVTGTHPVYSNIHFINGLGTKGALLAPYTALLLFNNLTKNIDIPAEADIARYFKRNQN